MKRIDPRRIEAIEAFIQEYGEDRTLKEVLNLELPPTKFRCPKCNGKGYILEKYNAYPSNLPDSGWGELWKYREKTCSLCNGEGWTDEEYEAVLETKIIGYHKK